MIVISSGCLNLVATEAKNVSHLSIGSRELPSWAHAEWRLSEIPGLFGPEARMGVTSPGPLFRSDTSTIQNTSRCLCHRGWRNVNSLFLPPIHQRVAEDLCSARFQSGPHCVPSFTVGDSKKKSSVYRLAGSQHSDSSGFCDWGASQFWRMTGPKCWVAIDKFAQCHTDSWPSERTRECCCVRQRKCWPLFWGKNSKKLIITDVPKECPH